MIEAFTTLHIAIQALIITCGAAVGFLALKMGLTIKGVKIGQEIKPENATKAIRYVRDETPPITKRSEKERCAAKRLVIQSKLSELLQHIEAAVYTLLLECGVAEAVADSTVDYIVIMNACELAIATRRVKGSIYDQLFQISEDGALSPENFRPRERAEDLAKMVPAVIDDQIRSSGGDSLYHGEGHVKKMISRVALSRELCKRKDDFQKIIESVLNRCSEIDLEHCEEHDRECDAKEYQAMAYLGLKND